MAKKRAKKRTRKQKVRVVTPVTIVRRKTHIPSVVRHEPVSLARNLAEVTVVETSVPAETVMVEAPVERIKVRSKAVGISRKGRKSA